MDNRLLRPALNAIAKMFAGLSILVAFAFLAGLALRFGALAFRLGWRGSW